MKVEDINRLFATIALLLTFASGYAQGWERTYGTANQETANDLVQATDGGYVLVGTTSTADFNVSHSDIILLRTDPDGHEEWRTTFGVDYQGEFGESVRPAANRGYIIGGSQLKSGIHNGIMILSDMLGDEIWKYKTVTDSVQGRQAIYLQDGNYLLVGNYIRNYSSTGNDDIDKDIFVAKVSADGVPMWEKHYGSNNLEEGFAVVEMPDNSLIIGGNVFDGENYDIFLLKLNANGNEIWQKTYGDEYEKELAYDLKITEDNATLILTGTEHEVGLTDDIFVLKTDINGNEPQWISVPQPNTQIATALQPLTGDKVGITGINYIDSTDNAQLFYSMVDESGLIFTQNFGGNDFETGTSLLINHAGNFAIAGTTNSYGAGNSDAYLVQNNGSNISISNTITGNISVVSGDCGPETSTQGAPNQIIQVNGSDIYYTVTDEFGNFSVNVPTGSYTVWPIALSPYWEVCQDTISVTFEGVFDTENINYTITPQVICPAMQTDIAVNHLRPGFQSTYTISYCNNGTIDATDAIVDVILDDFLSIDSCTAFYVPNGNNLIFPIGTVPPFTCHDFQIFATLDSTVTIGQTHCVEAYTYPDSLCLPINPAWDQSSITINAFCEYDSIKFKIQNEGWGDMDAPLNFIIIEDQIIGLTGEFYLESGKDTTIYVPTEGATIRMEAEQSEYHPGNSQPSIAVEGCSTEPGSTGHIIEFPQNDANPFLEIDCRENTSSYDPNDKQAFPRGYADEHFIEPNTDIEYLIRFQNEGTDTAFRVVIRDTLSAWLNEYSVIPGASSHHYDFELYNSNILKFTFNDIMLPQKDIDETGSMGFVKFRIQQREDNPIGTEILNSAAIYFDYNAPIITEDAYHVIGENFVEIDITSATTDEQNIKTNAVKVYPNPFNHQTTFEINNPTNQKVTFRLFDLNSQLVQQDTFSTNIYKFERRQIPSGLYIFRMEAAGRFLGSGKIVLK
jgi:hypothetical protein